MNHKIYFYNPCIILKIFHAVTFRSQTGPQSHLSFRSKSEVNITKNYISSTTKYIFHNIFIILKIYNYITFHTQIWP